MTVKKPAFIKATSQFATLNPVSSTGQALTLYLREKGLSYGSGPLQNQISVALAYYLWAEPTLHGCFQTAFCIQLEHPSQNQTGRLNIKTSDGLHTAGLRGGGQGLS